LSSHLERRVYFRSIAVRAGNYKGKVYQTTGVVNKRFSARRRQVGGSTFIAADPITVAGNCLMVIRRNPWGIGFTKRYDEAFGRGSTSAFSGICVGRHHARGSGHSGRLETPQYPEPKHSGLRSEMPLKRRSRADHRRPVTMSADDHNGYSDDAPVMITVKNGLFSINR